jgi:hypothetical protein
MHAYPDDEDGDALQRVAEAGAEMTEPMRIEFTIAVPSVECAHSLAERIAGLGYEPDLYLDEETGSVSLYCARMMLASYEGVVSAQFELNQLCQPVGANCDGWTTAGNRQDN